MDNCKLRGTEHRVHLDNTEQIKQHEDMQLDDINNTSITKTGMTSVSEEEKAVPAPPS